MRTITSKIIVAALLAVLLTVAACFEPGTGGGGSFFGNGNGGTGSGNGGTDGRDLPTIPDVPGLYVNGEYRGQMTFNAMLDWVADNSRSGAFYAMVIDADQTIMPVTFSYSGKTNIIIMLKSDGQERTFNLNQNGSMFKVGKGVSLVLEDKIIVRGRNNNIPIVVESDGRLIMNGGEIKENTSGSSAVFVKGTFIMNGGSIHDNTCSSKDNAGGAVTIYYEGIFTMNGGEIVQNISYEGGGVHLLGSKFVMNGGKIADNRTTYQGGGIYSGGRSLSSSIAIKGGEITGNTALYDGGGVYITAPGGYVANLTISGGVIHGNTASQRGGGICGGTLTITGGVISGNNAMKEGGGIYAHKFIKSASGGVIYGSNAALTLKNGSGNDTGHAVYISGSPFKKRNTTVESNMALESDRASGWE